uniref:Uncharacterized protein n=1 Tax=Syphacia muris TaxID=451379 RepID=A0A0N5AJT1_9BILA
MSITDALSMMFGLFDLSDVGAEKRTRIVVSYGKLLCKLDCEVLDISVLLFLVLGEDGFTFGVLLLFEAQSRRSNGLLFRRSVRLRGLRRREVVR